MYEGRKIVGSAQVRRREAFLQHGSIPYHADAPRLAAAIGAGVDAEKFSALGKLLGRPPQDAEVDAALISGFEAAFGTRLVAARRTGWERQRAEQLRCWKYLSYAWTIEGRLGEVERAHAPAGLF